MKPNPEVNVHTVGGAISYYLKNNILSGKTRAGYFTVKTRLEEAKLLHKNIEAFTPVVFRKFLNSLDVAETTRHAIYYIKIKAVLEMYCREHSIHLPFTYKRMLKLPKKVEAPEGEEQFLTLNELRKLMNADVSHDYDLQRGKTLFLLMCWTGCSVSDIYRMNPLHKISPDGKKFIYLRKKNGLRAVVPVMPALTDLLNNTKWPMKKICPRRMMMLVSPLAQFVGRKVTCHMARKTFGSIMIEAGFSMEMVSKMMGHTSITTTQKYYVRITEDKLDREISALPQSIIELMS